MNVKIGRRALFGKGLIIEKKSSKARAWMTSVRSGEEVRGAWGRNKGTLIETHGLPREWEATGSAEKGGRGELNPFNKGKGGPKKEKKYRKKCSGKGRPRPGNLTGVGRKGGSAAGWEDLEFHLEGGYTGGPKKSDRNGNSTEDMGQKTG